MTVESIFRTLFTRMRALERRVEGANFKGKVAEVDAETRKARIVIGKSNDGTDVLGPWVPYAQTSGALKIHNPPSVGQLMSMSAEAGDVEQGLLTPYQWSGDNADNHDAGDEHRLTFGDVQVDLTGSGIVLVAGGVRYTWNGDGFSQTGGEQEHNGKNVGSTHKHDKVMPGGGVSGTPI